MNFKIISNRIMEVYIIYKKGIYIGNSNERYIISEKFVKIFMSYNIDYLKIKL